MCFRTADFCLPYSAHSAFPLAPQPAICLSHQVSFTDGIRDGIFDRDTGEYINNVTGERVATQEAIMRGFIKARVVSDPSKLPTDPNNQVVIKKLSSAKLKMKMAAAFRK